MKLVDYRMRPACSAFRKTIGLSITLSRRCGIISTRRCRLVSPGKSMGKKQTRCRQGWRLRLAVLI